MAIPTVMSDLSTTIASNSPAGSDSPTQGDDNIRAAFGILRRLSAYGIDIASGTTITPDTLASSYNVSGTTTITTIASTNSWDGRELVLRFTGVLTLTHSSTLVLPGAANITTAANDIAVFRQRTSGTWDCLIYQKASGVATVVSAVTLTQLDANWSFDGSHRLLNGGATQPFFRANRTANQTSGNIIIFTTETTDRGAWHDNATGVVTIPVTGVYDFDWNVGISNASGGTLAPKIGISLNGVTTLIAAAPQTILTGAATVFSGSLKMALTAADTISLYCDTTFSASFFVVASTGIGNSQPQWSGYLLG